jgi:S-adenosylmethionine/arginine decarboxylase-like enzyme
MINAKVDNPMSTETQMKEFLEKLTANVNIKIIKDPIIIYFHEEGNRGLRAISMTESNHMSVHIWDEPRPSLVRFDIYSGMDLDWQRVLETFKEYFDCDTFNFALIDRKHAFQGLSKGTYYRKDPFLN